MLYTTALTSVSLILLENSQLRRPMAKFLIALTHISENSISCRTLYPSIRNWTKVLAVCGHTGWSERQRNHLFPDRISEAKPFRCISISIVSVRKDAGNRLITSIKRSSIFRIYTRRGSRNSRNPVGFKKNELLWIVAIVAHFLQYGFFCIAYERTACERVNNRILNDYHLQNLKICRNDHHTFWIMIIGICIHLDAWYKNLSVTEQAA